MQPNKLDKAISYLFPGYGTKRMLQRAQANELEKHLRSYEGASKGRRTQQWKPPSSSAPSEIQRALTDLRNRSRDLVRNNAYARRGVKKIANGVVGTGITPSPIVSSKPQEKKIKTLWNKWAESIHCDYDGHLNFYGIQKLVMRTVAESGECIVRKRIVSDPSLPFALQLQVLEGDFIATMKHAPMPDASGSYVMYGIEFNKNHKVAAYWLYDTHPGDTFRFSLTYTRYPVDEIIHVFEKERPGQYRGVPMGYASMLRLKDLDEYEDAQLIRQKIAACFSVFITDSSNITTSLDKSDDDDFLEKVEPGIIERLKPGQTVTMASPPGTDGYGEYTKNVLRAVAAGYDMDYVSLTGDYSQTNFSSGRMGWIEFHKSINDWQWNMLVPMFCHKSWSWFIQIASVYGIIRAGVDVGSSWSAPRREMINPEAETKAIIEAVQNGIVSWSDVQLESGYNPDEQIEKMKNDKDAFEKAGLPFYSNKVIMSAKGDTPVQQAPANTDQ